MNDKLVTLIGGGGFVGRYVAQALLATGARVRIAQRDPRQAFFLKLSAGSVRRSSSVPTSPSPRRSRMRCMARMSW